MKKITLVFIIFFCATFAFAQKADKDYEAGKKAYDSQNYKGAISTFGKIIAKNPNHIMARYYRGLAYSEMKLYKDGLADMNEAIKIIPTNADFYYQRAMIKKKQGNNDQAIGDLDNAIILDDKQATYYLERGMLHTASKNNSDAANDFAQAQLLNPDNEEIRNNFKTAFEKITKDERDELAVSSGLTAAGFGGGDKPVVKPTATPDDKNTLAEKAFLAQICM